MKFTMYFQTTPSRPDRAAIKVETREMDHRDGNILALTIEHATQRTDIPQFSFEQVAA
jgi:hypothetical protein